jgi:hypothetical protein
MLASVVVSEVVVSGTETLEVLNAILRLRAEYRAAAQL